VVTSGGDTFTTRLRGTVFLNASTNPPQPGADVEIARLKLTADNFRAGGTFGAISMVHPQRLWGTFVDSTHFQIAPRAAEFVVAFTLVGSAITRRVVLSNDTGITGVLDLGAGTLSLSAPFQGSCNGLVLSFTGSVVRQPSAPANQPPVAM
jgi:hypothetical protein